MIKPLNYRLIKAGQIGVVRTVCPSEKNGSGEVAFSDPLLPDAVSAA